MRGREFTPEDGCAFRARHLIPATYVTPNGEKRAGIDWQDRASRKVGESRRDHPLYLPGRERPCRICRRPSMLADCAGRPCHKVCAEDEFLAGTL